MTSVLVEGETCWKIAGADRVSVIVDAAAFFQHARSAMLKAERSIFMVGWDFDTRINLVPGKAEDEAPEKLGSFLNWLARRRDDLDVRILKWDIGLINSITRGETPFYILRWLFSKRVQLKLDSAHPPLSAHHMKLLVIDDRVAFCGGIDMTVGRWDTREHLESDKRRLSPLGFSQGPWHDVTSCISGDAAAELGQLARTRWELATAETLEPVVVSSDPWPDALDVDFHDISVAIARTLPEFDKQSQVCEIEAAKLAIIASTKTCLYIESQYFASRKVAEAIAARLQETNGPEIILINPDGAEGWLEAKAMDSARIRLMKLVRDADTHGRFRLMYPVNDQRTPIYVHAKVMIADDRLIKIGSANLNNRSMGYDSECDVVIEARPDQGILSAKITEHRNGLISEHLGCDPQELQGEIETRGSVIRAIDALNRASGRGLVDVPMRDLTVDEELFAESDIADPERPSGVKERVTRRFKRRRAS
ncbi:phospholipase D-like domain-containing protein [Agrobacterium sp. rho-8.1]|nr:phospholipase D-like domain-containing protein [Agrobacterium sp. rho-8.1]